jgi:alpha-L-rhamnosidase
MNRKILKAIIPLMLFLLINSTHGKKQINSFDILHRQWAAYWIQVPGEPNHSFGVYLFRKKFNLIQIPASFIINVSADNRYKLYVNGRLISIGPARCDVLDWRFETVDIAPLLSPGKNVIAAIVWNDGDMSSLAQISYRTGFILQGNSSAEEIVNTNSSWKCIKDDGYSQLKPHVNGYYAASPGECLDMNKHSAAWKNINYNDDNWLSSAQICHGNPKGIFTFDFGWMLVPSIIPPMEMRREQNFKIREAAGINIPGKFLSENSPLVIPADTQAVLLLDQSYLTNAYLTVLFSRGRDAGISIKYAESLYSMKKDSSSSKIFFYKTNRNDIIGKVFIGLQDSLISNGEDNQSFTSLWWRAYRYIKIEVRTKNDPLIIKDIYGTYTGYPFNLNAKFESPDSVLKNIFNVGWHTARLCAFETYMDCPYYEQLQYIGDTRIQALVSYFNSGDSKLARNAIDLLDESRIASGLTQSRYPSSPMQLIPTFSLWWIGMLYDYWIYTPDSEFVKSKLPGERQILSFFQKFQLKDGSINNLPYWNFTDWINSEKWEHGVPPIGNDGTSSILDLQLLWAYELAAQLENKFGMNEYSKLYAKKALQLKNTILKKYWDNTRNEFADTHGKKLFSQHANALAILTEVISGKDALLLGKKILSDTTLTQATIYFKYYVNQALIKAGLGNDYQQWLDVWKENLKYGMTTFAEFSNLQNTRSDCHGWGASPNIEFFRTILGIDSYSPGFHRVKIEPHLGSLKWANGEVPHPNGKITVSYKLKQSKWMIDINLPEKTLGFFIWKGKKYKLNIGANHLIIK